MCIFHWGGGKCSIQCTLFNLFVVWMLTGVWHGANWTFLVWGLLYAIVLSLEKMFLFKNNKRKGSHIYTLFIVVLLWVIFRANSLSDAISYLMDMFMIRSNRFIDHVFYEYWSSSWILFIVSVGMCIPVKSIINERVKNRWCSLDKICEIFYLVAIVFFFVVAVTVSFRATYSPFIYFNF